MVTVFDGMKGRQRTQFMNALGTQARLADENIKEAKKQLQLIERDIQIEVREGKDIPDALKLEKEEAQAHYWAQVRIRDLINGERVSREEQESHPLKFNIKRIARGVLGLDHPWAYQ
ncbi:MAG: hypothetical protein MUD10_02785 [Candidatus Pacebacteria bacterium]|jgi:transcriptional regulator|nr:hypothetical protein [Candidatus Paceibacterota bacterium]